MEQTGQAFHAGKLVQEQDIRSQRRRYRDHTIRLTEFRHKVLSAGDNIRLCWGVARCLLRHELIGTEERIDFDTRPGTMQGSVSQFGAGCAVWREKGSSLTTLS